MFGTTANIFIDHPLVLRTTRIALTRTLHLKMMQRQACLGSAAARWSCPVLRLSGQPVSSSKRIGALVAATSKQTETEPSMALSTLSVNIPTPDARNCIRFKVVPTGPAQQAIIVDAVAEGSSAAEAGVQRGMKLTGISDPVRRDDVWELQDRPSIRYVRDVLRMRSSPMIELRFSQAPGELLDAMDAADDALQLASSNNRGSRDDTSSVISSSSIPEASASSSSSSGYQPGSDSDSSLSTLESLSLSSSEESGATMAERLQQQFERQQQASQGVTAYEQRQERRKAYMEQEGKRNDSTFFVLIGASFLLPAVVILSIAWGSGYLDALYSNTMTYMR